PSSRRLAEFAAGTSLARWYKFDLAVQLTWQWQTLVAVSVMTPAKIGDYENLIDTQNLFHMACRFCQFSSAVHLNILSGLSSSYDFIHNKLLSSFLISTPT
ncbi:MAG: hypothetical protein KKA54_21395, partial [Proteobacteria bacterium]|nr:hypothetical protein [Pseudomonadota bacterium]